MKNKILNKSNILINNNFSKPRINQNLNPWQITGLVDGEGGFFCTISKNKVRLEFKITQKIHSEGILYETKKYFECGNVVIDNRKTETKKYQVTKLNDILNKIIPHFENYSCLTSKFLNYKNWKEIAIIMSKDEHLTNNGLKK